MTGRGGRSERFSPPTPTPIRPITFGKTNSGHEAKSKEMTMTDTAIETDAYIGTHDYFANFVNDAPSQKLAAALALNAAMEIYHDVHGGDAFEKALRQALEAVPAREAKTRNKLQ